MIPFEFENFFFNFCGEKNHWDLHRDCIQSVDHCG